MTDFFISYTEIDRPWAEWIGWVLEEAGFSVVLQHWDFAEAGNFVLDMHRAMAEASQTIAVLSPEYLCSRFCAAEWAAAFAKDPDGLRHRLLPIRVRECQLDGLWTAITHIDLVGLDDQRAEQRLLARVRVKRGKPTERPPFPGTALPPEVPGVPGPARSSLTSSETTRLDERRPEENVDASAEINSASPKSQKIKRKGAVELYSEMERSAAFFEMRFAEAFPGWRENLVVSDPQRACDHLLRLLRAPLSASNEKFTTHPIWWWRGHENMWIDKIRRVELTRLLMDSVELEIDYIIPFPLSSYKRRFVYVQTKGMDSTGLYPDTHYNNMERSLESIGYCREEYGIFRGRLVTRSEYDDDGAQLDGKFIRFNGKAQLRIRTLTAYNFLIAAQESPINNPSCNEELDSLLNNILVGKYDAKELANFVKALPAR